MLANRIMLGLMAAGLTTVLTAGTALADRGRDRDRSRGRDDDRVLRADSRNVYRHYDRDRDVTGPHRERTYWFDRGHGEWRHYGYTPPPRYYTYTYSRPYPVYRYGYTCTYVYDRPYFCRPAAPPPAWNFHFSWGR